MDVNFDSTPNFTTLNAARKQQMMTMTMNMMHAQALIEDLSHQVQADDVDGGKLTLTKLKVGRYQWMFRVSFCRHVL